ncbi:Glycine--tRNA ligase 1, mitochondrial [Arachnomyces sp. PD_36]|nr:Glycine--tRNA ligase 1, mitochondrial [Arachnomyces sp. PD_36]
MAPEIRSAKITASCPLFAADFDPRNNDYLVVGGGGGEGRSGVGNKIARLALTEGYQLLQTLFDTSKSDVITEAADVQLSSNEDSVTSLGVAQSKEDSIVAYAGINSSQEEQNKGKNEHFRSFKLEFPKDKSTEETSEDTKTEERKPTGTITPLSKSAIFKSKATTKDSAKDNVEAYQRVLRLSPWRGENSPRIAAVATGLAPSGEIVVVNATATPQLSNVLGRVRLDDREEAEDVDIIDTDGKNFRVAYLVGHEVYMFNVSSSKSKNSPQPSMVYTAPFPDYFASNKRRPKYRALRFLSPKTLVVLENKPDRTGSGLLMLSLPESGKGLATVMQRKRLHRSMKIGLGLDVCALSASPKGEKQYIVAISGNDHSIELLTLESSTKSGFGKLRHYKTLRDVHPLSMTKLCFSTFISPQLPLESTVPPQYVKLASVSMGNTIVVHTIPVSPHPGPSRNPRYVLVKPGMPDAVATILSSLVAIIVVILGAFFLQAFTEIRGGVPPSLGATEWLSPRLKEMIAKPYIFENTPRDPRYVSSPESTTPGANDIPTIKTPLRDLLSARREAVDTPLVIVVRDDGTEISAKTQSMSVDGGEDDGGAGTRGWDELGEEERGEWKRRLSQAGHWSPEEGEGMLSGVFFGHLPHVGGGGDDGHADGL